MKYTAFVLAVLALAGSARAEDAQPVDRQIAELRQQVEELRREVAELKKMLAQPETKPAVAPPAVQAEAAVPKIGMSEADLRKQFKTKPAGSGTSNGVKYANYTLPNGANVNCEKGKVNSISITPVVNMTEATFMTYNQPFTYTLKYDRDGEKMYKGEAYRVRISSGKVYSVAY